MAKRYIKPKTCVVCAAVFTPRSWNPYMVPICSPACKRARREARAKKVQMNCTQCGTPTALQGRNGLRQALTGRAYCSEACKKAWTSVLSARSMANTNRKYASARMKERNPMAREEIRSAVSARLKEIGHAPRVRGGNGNGPVKQERALLTALPAGWIWNFILPTCWEPGSELPKHYKLNLALPEKMVAVEVDGGSHKSLKVKEADVRKTDFLTGSGWTVLRFTNQEVDKDLPGVTAAILSTTSK